MRASMIFSRFKVMLLVGVVAVIATCLPSQAMAWESQAVDAGHLFNYGYYFYRNPSCRTDTSHVSGDFSYIVTRNPYFPENSGGSYGEMMAYSTRLSPEQSIGKRIVVRYPNAGTVRDASRPNYAEECDLEITFIVREAQSYVPDEPTNATMGLPGTTEIGVATDLSRGFRFTGISYAEMQVRFYKRGTNNIIPIGSMWFGSASLQAVEGFTIDNSIEAYTTGDAYYINPDIARPGWRNNAVAASPGLTWRAFPGSYVYEYGHVGRGSSFGYVGTPPVAAEYEAIDEIPSDHTFPDGMYFKRTLNWRAGAVLADLSTTDVLSGAIFAWSFDKISQKSSSVASDLLHMHEQGFDTSIVSGAIWLVPNFLPATGVMPPPPVKSVDKTRVNPNDTVKYTVTQRIAKRGGDMSDDFGYDKFVFYDDLPYGLDYVNGSFAVYNQSGTNVVSNGTFSRNNQHIEFSFNETYLDRLMVYDGGNYRFEFSAKVNADALQNSSITKYDNKAHTVFNNQFNLESNLVTTVPYVVDVDVNKVSAYPDLLNGNSLYSLSNAKFNAFKESNSTVLHTYVTDATGHADAHRFSGAGTHYIEEVQRSAGHTIPTDYRKSFTLNEGAAAGRMTLTFTEPSVVYYTESISAKKDSDAAAYTERPAWQGDSGDGSKYKVRVNFYPNNNWSGLPFASAVFGADANGKVAFSNATPVDGTTWRYRYNNQNVIPLGTITVTEIAAPDGYKVNGTPVKARIVDSNGTARLERV